MLLLIASVLLAMASASSLVAAMWLWLGPPGALMVIALVCGWGSFVASTNVPRKGAS